MGVERGGIVFYGEYTMYGYVRMSVNSCVRQHYVSAVGKMPCMK